MSHKIQNSWNLLPEEIVYSITRWNQSTGTHYICVTTAIKLNSEDKFDRKGRILLFQIIQAKDSQDVDMDSEKSDKGFMLLLQLQQTDLGPGLCSSVYQGYLLVGCYTDLHMFQLADVDNNLTLKLVAAYYSRFPILSVSTNISRIALATQKDGVSLLTFREESKELVLLARDGIPRMTSDVLMLDDENMVGVDKVGTFFHVRYQEKVNLDMYKPLKEIAAFGLRETSLRIRKGNLAIRQQEESENVTSNLVVASVHGSVGVLVSITKEQFDRLYMVQTKMENNAITRPLLGNQLQAYRSDMQPWKNIIDGDFLSTFLELPRNIQLQIIEADVIHKVVGDIESIHQRLK